MMQTPTKFPDKLLLESNSVRMQYFFSYTVAHPKLKKAFELLSSVVKESVPGTLIFVTGPAGVGKTTLKLRMESEIINEMKAELEVDKSCFPVVAVTAISPETGNFNWKDFYKRLLIALEEPCVEKKYVPFSYGNKQIDTDTGSITIGAAQLRYVAEKIIKLRKSKVIFIDEAQHMGKMAIGRRLQDQLDCIKSLADITKTSIGMFGTYEMLSFRNLSAQLSRRSVDIHLKRYYANSEDINAFKNVLWAFQRHLPLNEEPDLLANWDYFYERTIGCVGVLKDWLSKALAKALKEKKQVLKEEHLESTSLSLSQCERMLTEALEGEGRFKESVSSRNLLRTNLGLDSLDEAKKQEEIQHINPVNEVKRQLQPGERKPKRDPVGRN